MRRHRPFWVSVLAYLMLLQSALRNGQIGSEEYAQRVIDAADNLPIFAAAAALLRLSEDELVHALGTAGTQAAGLWAFLADGAMSKSLHPGKAAHDGILSADLGRQADAARGAGDDSGAHGARRSQCCGHVPPKRAASGVPRTC